MIRLYTKHIMTSIQKITQILTLFMLLLTGCRSASTDVYMAQLKSRDAGFEEALNTDNLTYEDGCLFAGSGDQRTLIVWQSGYSNIEQDDNLIVVDRLGRQVAMVGEVLYMGGGYSNAVDDAELKAPIPSTCKTEEIFRMGEFLAEEYR